MAPAAADCTIMSGALTIAGLTVDDQCCSDISSGANEFLAGTVGPADLTNDESCGSDACGTGFQYAFGAAEAAGLAPAGTGAGWGAACGAYNNAVADTSSPSMAPANTPAWLQTFTDCAEVEDSTFVASSFSAEVQCAMGALIGPDTRDTLEDGT